MRLSAEQVRQGLFHDDLEVRQRCLEYFTDMWSLDESVMQAVTQVIDTRGRDAFRFYHHIDQLVQTDVTIQWVVRSLGQTPRFFDDPMIRDFRPLILLHSRCALLQQHRDEILSVLSSTDQVKINRRLQFLSESPDALWKQLNIFCEQCASGERPRNSPVHEAEDLVITLAELGSVPVDRMMELLQSEIPTDRDLALAWLSPFLMKLAGLIRYQPALPILVEKLRIDNSCFSEESMYAMIRLGTDDVVRTVAKLISKETWHWQLYASSVFENIHSDEAVRAATELLQDESLKEDIRQHIAHGLACQFSTEGLDTLATYLDSHTDWLENSEWTETLPSCQASAKLLQVDSSRFDDWNRQTIEARESGRASLFGRDWDSHDDDFEDDDAEDDFEVDDDFQKPVPVETVVYDAPRVGRNDACPCGSGKKFKKCCLGKGNDR